MIGATLLATILLLNRYISVGEGLALLTLLIVLVTRTVHQARQEADQNYETAELKNAPGVILAIILTIVGLALLLGGSNLFVDGAVNIARQLGWSEKLIGLTIVAIGTSLPELATSVVAVIKGQNDVAIGNVVGSCVFNILGILGVTGVLGGAYVPELSLIDLGVLVGVTVAVFPLVRSGGRISRIEGGGLLLTYFAYTGWLLWG